MWPDYTARTEVADILATSLTSQPNGR